MKKTNKIVMAVAMLCCAAPSLAQTVNPSWYVQGSVLGLRPDVDFGVDDDDWGAGLKLGKPVSQMWDVQMGISHARIGDSPYRYRQTLLGADALLMLSRGRMRPFILLGLGVQRDRVESALSNTRSNSPFATAGIGLQLSLTERLSMQADLRTVRGRLRNEERFGFGTNNNRYLTVGFNYALNAPPPPLPPEPLPPPVAQQPEAVPAPVPAPAPPRFEKVTMSATELFAFDSAALTMPQPRLDEIAAALTADPSISDVDITGHADRLGSAAYNLRLSQRRAESVREYLVGKGIEGTRLKAIGRGEESPVVTCNDKRRADLIKCLEPNRRVEVEQITIERRVQ